MGRIFGYRSPFARWLAPVVVGVFVVAAVGLVVASATNTGPPTWFVAVWIAVLCWNAYWFLWKIGHSIEVDGSQVTWRAVLRRRTLELTDLTGNGSLWTGYQRLEVREAPSLMLMSRDRSWLRFLDELNSAHPNRPFSPTLSDRMIAKWPLSDLTTGYYERFE